MNDDAIDELLNEALGRAGPPAWTGDTELADLPGIDSLKQTSLVLAVEARRGRKLELDELLELETVADLRRLLQAPQH